MPKRSVNTTTLKMPRKTERLEFEEDGYPGFWADAWPNPPISVENQFLDQSLTEVEHRELALQFFPDWNFVDYDGNPIPHTVDGFDQIPQELMIVMSRRRMRLVFGTASPNLESGSSSGPNRAQRRAADRRKGKSGTS